MAWSTTGTVTHRLWIGLSRAEGSDGPYQWQDGSPVDSDDYQAWNDGQPDDWNGIEDCVHLAGAGWNDNQCSKEYGYVCSYLLDEKPRGTCPEYCETEGVLSCEGHCEHCCSFAERQHDADAVSGCPSDCVTAGEVKCTGHCGACCERASAAKRPDPTPAPTFGRSPVNRTNFTSSARMATVLPILSLAFSL
jgi:hypothetical protein